MITPIAISGVQMDRTSALQPMNFRQQETGATESPSASFSGLLSNAVQQANVAQSQADEAIQKVTSGEGGDLHQAMLSMEQARMSMMTVVETRNKLLDAYQEITRMPV